MSDIDRYDKFKLMTGLTVSLVAFVFFFGRGGLRTLMVIAGLGRVEIL